MNNDGQKKSFEKLDESRYERGKRTFFDWLVGREESEEEKLRKKLDKELKEAARKRAEQFEEELRQQEQRDEAETKKLKKRWRKKLVEKSEAQLAEAKVRDESTMNGYEIAQVMVAERIVKLHEMLQDESLDLRRSEVKGLKIHIDFMGLLSEKLSRPELEVPEEVEQLYHTIAASIEDTTGETAPGGAEPEDHEPSAPEATSPKFPEQNDKKPEISQVSEADTSYTAFATAIVYAIKRSVKSAEDQSSVKESSSNPEVNPATQPSTSETPTVESTPKIPPSVVDSIRQTAQSSSEIRQEIARSNTVKRMAEIVEKAEMMNVHATSKSPEIIPALAATKAAKLAYREELKTSSGNLRPVSSAERFPDIPVELWNEADLVRKAEQVDIGNGRRLASAYRNGEIDREGLIKVLKSHKKHKNHLEEFRHQASRWRQSREFSPENLKNISEQSQQTASLPAPETPQDQTSRQISKPSTARQLLRKVTSQPFSEIEQRMRDARDQVKKQASFVMMLSSLLLLIMLVVIIWFINSL